MHQHRPSPLPWFSALQHAIDTMIADRDDPRRCRPSLQVVSASNTGHRFEVELRFHVGMLYCCSEPNCFLHTHRRDWWTDFRAALDESTGRSPPPMSITIQIAVEEGARLTTLLHIGINPPISRAYTATQTDHEHDAR